MKICRSLNWTSSHYNSPPNIIKFYLHHGHSINLIVVSEYCQNLSSTQNTIVAYLHLWISSNNYYLHHSTSSQHIFIFEHHQMLSWISSSLKIVKSYLHHRTFIIIIHILSSFLNILKSYLHLTASPNFIIISEYHQIFIREPHILSSSLGAIKWSSPLKIIRSLKLIEISLKRLLCSPP